MQILELTAVVPLAPAENAWQGLCPYLGLLAANCQVIFVRPSPPSRAERAALTILERRLDVQWLLSSTGRARQMNAGAHRASKPMLWFIHADSRFGVGVLPALEQGITLAPEAIHYFNLAYLDDGPYLAHLNAWGANLRARLFGMPFGDQGLCLPRDLFERLGGFDEGSPYGEDHLLVWRARQLAIPLRGTGAVLYSSARKFQVHGWARTTLRHGLLTWKQALPQYLHLLTASRGKDRRSSLEEP